MAPVAKKVATPGSYNIGKKKPLKKTPKKKGRPGRTPRGPPRKGNYRSTYTPADMEKAVKLVKEEEYSVAAAARECKVWTVHY